MSSTSEFLKNYDLVEPTIRALYDSKLRLAILDALSQGPMRLADLRREVKANAPNTSSTAKDLEGMGLLERVDGDFRLTPYGNIVREQIAETLAFHATYEKYKKYWDARDLSGIPDFLLRRLGDLENANLILNDPSDVQAPVEDFYKFIERITEFGYAITSVMDPRWIRLLIGLFKKSVRVKLIVTPEVFGSLKKNLTKEEKQKIIRYDGIEFYELKKELNFVFAVCDNAFDINCKLKQGPETYYMEADLMAFDKKAIQWGLDLFEYYKKQSKQVNIADYL